MIKKLKDFFFGSGALKFLLLGLLVIGIGLLFNVAYQSYIIRPLQGAYEKTSELKYDYYYEPFLESLSKPFIILIQDSPIKTLSINGIPFDMMSITNQYNHQIAFSIPISEYAKLGNNVIEITLSHVKWSKRLKLRPSPIQLLHPLVLIPLLLLIGSVMLFFYHLLRTLGFERRMLWILLLGVLTHLITLTYTDYYRATHDVIENTGHLDYIQYLIDHKKLPNPTHGWEYHQPPLYYLSVAAITSIGSALGVLEIEKLMQACSFVLFMLFLIFGVKTLSLFITEEKIAWVCSALLVFWSSGFIHSARIGNDTAVYFLIAAGLYYVSKWHLGRMRIDILIASIFGAIGFLTKTTSASLMGIIGVVLVVDFIKDRNKIEFIKRYWVVVPILLLGVGLNFADNIYYAVKDHQDWLVGQAAQSIDKKLSVNNELHNYVGFDFKTYLTEPFTHSRDDRYGRQYFWTYLMKTALFGEFRYGAFQGVLALIVGYLLLVLVGFFVYGLYTVFLQKAWGALIPISFIVLSLALIIVFRVKMPVACNGDFRYIFPSLIGFISIIGYSLGRLSQWKNPILYRIGIGVILSMCTLSILFFG